MSNREKCRGCGQKLTGKAKESSPWYPFCSERCQLVDLGQWFDQKYRLTDREERAKGSGEDPNGANEDEFGKK